MTLADVGDLGLPFTLRPDEHIVSFLVRHAARFRIPYPELAVATGLLERPTSIRERVWPQWHLAAASPQVTTAFTTATGLEQADLNRMLLGDLHAAYGLPPDYRMARHNTFVLFGRLNYCPECLDEGRGWRRQWATAVAFACTRHRCRLLSTCPHGHPVHPGGTRRARKGGLGGLCRWQSVTELNECNFVTPDGPCHDNLAHAPADRASRPAIRAQRRLEAIYESQDEHLSIGGSELTGGDWHVVLAKVSRSVAGAIYPTGPRTRTTAGLTTAEACEVMPLSLTIVGDDPAAAVVTLRHIADHTAINRPFLRFEEIHPVLEQRLISATNRSRPQSASKRKNRSGHTYPAPSTAKVVQTTSPWLADHPRLLRAIEIDAQSRLTGDPLRKAAIDLGYHDAAQPGSRVIPELKSSLLPLRPLLAQRLHDAADRKLAATHSENCDHRRKSPMRQTENRREIPVVVVQGTFDLVEGEREELLTSRVEPMRRSRAEAGCLEYTFAADPLEATRVVLTERWESRAHLDAHLAALRSAPPATGGPTPRGQRISIFTVAAEEVL